MATPMQQDRQLPATQQAFAPPATFDFQPTSLQEAMQLAQMLSDADMVPESYRGKPGNVLLAMQMGAELGLKVMQAIQNIAVIGKRPAVWGDSMLALVKASPYCEYVVEEIHDDHATCRVKRRGEPEQSRTFTKADAEKAGLWTKDGPWKNYPKRMLQMRARAFALRDVFPDVLKGMPIAEEVRDYVDVTAQGEATVGETTGKAVDGEHQPAPASKSDRVKEQLKQRAGEKNGDRIPTADEVVKAYDDATTPEHLAAAALLAKKLPDDFSVNRAREARDRAKTRIANAQVQAAAAQASASTQATATSTSTTPPDDALVLRKIEAAKTLEEFYLAIDAIRQFPEGEVKQRLQQAAKTKQAQLEADDNK